MGRSTAFPGARLFLGVGGDMALWASQAARHSCGRGEDLPPCPAGSSAGSGPCLLCPTPCGASGQAGAPSTLVLQAGRGAARLYVREWFALVGTVAWEDLHPSLTTEARLPPQRLNSCRCLFEPLKCCLENMSVPSRPPSLLCFFCFPCFFVCFLFRRIGVFFCLPVGFFKPGLNV